MINADLLTYVFFTAESKYGIVNYDKLFNIATKRWWLSGHRMWRHSEPMWSLDKAARNHLFVLLFPFWFQTYR